MVKKAVVAVLGTVLLVLGVGLLVLPGPGFLLIAGALAVLSTEFKWAKKPLDYAKDKADLGIREVARSKARTALVVLCALALMALGVLDLAGLDVPWVNKISAALLIVSGLLLAGTLVYALRRGEDSEIQEPATRR